MNVLREVRRINKKNILVKIKIIAFLCIMLIASVYAWFATTKNGEIGNLEGRVLSWDVIYVHEDDIKENEVTINIENFYPGKEYTKYIYIYNIGSEPTDIEVELIDVELFGESKLEYLLNSENNAISTESDASIEYNASGNVKNNIVNLFGNDEYSFELGYLLNKNKLRGTYDPDNPNENQEAQAYLKIDFSWLYDVANSAEDSNTTVRDNIDTEIGKDAYNYYNSISNQTNYDELKSQALEITLKIKSSNASEEDS